MAVPRTEVARRALSVVTHRTHSLPLVVLMPHSRCNARCLMCDIWMGNHDKRELGVDDLRPLLDAFERLNTRRVVLSGGEALLHPNLWLFTSMLERTDVRITLLSTGLTLKKHASDVARWCDEVVVSLDGARDVHDAIRRVPNAFDRLAEGVAEVRRESGAVRITGRSVVQRANFSDLFGTIEAAREIGLDAISFLPVDVSSQAFNRLPVWGQERVNETALTYDEANELEVIVERAIVRYGDDIDRGFIAESRTKLRRIPAYFLAVLGHRPFPPVRCNAPWVSAVIEADGTVRPCFFHRPLGNIRENGLEDILGSPAAVAFRRSLDISADPTCTRCVCSLEIGPRTEV